MSRIGSNTNLTDVGRRIGLDVHLILHPGHLGNATDKIVATAVEAIIAVVYLDSGKDMAVVKSAMDAMGLKADTAN